MYSLRDPPLVLHIANLLMISIVGQQFKIMAQHCHLQVQPPVLGLESNPSHVCRSTLCYRLAFVEFNFKMSHSIAVVDPFASDR